MRILLPLTVGILACGAIAQPSVVPPAMTKRVIAPSTNELHGTRVVLNDDGVSFTLYLPSGWTNRLSSNITLYAHFHLVPWFAIQEHVRRGAREPLLVFVLGEGSTTYRLPFQDTNRFARVLALTEAELQRRGSMPRVRVVSVDVSSFSAGYGAVRELIKTPQYFKLIRRIVLLDSIYASLEPVSSSQTNRVPAAAQIDVWGSFAAAAVRGEKTFVLTHSQVPTSTYASSAECAAALLARIGLQTAPVSSNSVPAANDADYPLLARSDAKGLHVWSYAGADGQAHTTHARHLADVWRALDTDVLSLQRPK